MENRNNVVLVLYGVVLGVMRAHDEAPGGPKCSVTGQNSHWRRCSQRSPMPCGNQAGARSDEA